MLVFQLCCSFSSMVARGNLELNLVLSHLFTLLQIDQKLERSRNAGFSVFFW